MEFIKASDIKSRKETIDSLKIESFIKLFNIYIKPKNDNGDGSYSLNTNLNNIPWLNDAEFNKVVSLAKKSGWELTRMYDNYQSESYIMKKYNL